MGFFDDIVSDSVAPPWLQQGAYGRGPGVGGRYLQTIGIELDTIAARAKAAAYNGLPLQCDPSALPLIGDDRLMIQGASESNAAVAIRLSQAFDAWRVGGSDWGVLWEVLSLFAGQAGGTPPGRIVSNTKRWSYYPAAATLTVPPLVTDNKLGNWNWDGGAEVTGLAPVAVPWWRYWLILDAFAPTAWCAAAPVLGGGRVLGGGLAIGFNISGAIFASIRTILRSWQAAHAWSRWIVVNFSSGQYTPDGVNAEPDGTWGPWVKLVVGFSVAGVGQWVPTRDATARYVDGIADGS